MKKLFWIIGAVVTIIIGIYVFNYLTIIEPGIGKIKEDTRNEGILVDAHYKFYVFPNTLIFNIKDVSLDKASADVFRVFLQVSSGLKDKKFDKIELQYRGTTKFFLNGDYYGRIGSEFGAQNPIYTIRTFPENLYNANGELPYSKWEGGMLGVFSKQMEDFEDFNKKWYMEDRINEIEN